MRMDANDFFAPWESTISSFDEINQKLTDLFERWVEENDRTFAWRGVVNASWPLHSSLYRRLVWTQSAGSKAPDEPRLAHVEKQVLTSVHRWGLHDGDRGRLSILAQLATLQHFGAPTRLIDVTLNAYIGLWFAVQPGFVSGVPDEDSEIDGRLFAIDITNRLINERDDRRDWEDKLHRPWKETNNEWQRKWCGEAVAWKPPAFEARIAAQNGAFLFGGVPRTNLGIVWPKDTSTGPGWKQDEVRRCVSVPLRFHKVQPLAGGVQTARGQPAYTFRIKASAKQEIRERLRTLFGFEYSTIYPDFPGFAEFAEPHLRTAPPGV